MGKEFIIDFFATIFLMVLFLLVGILLFLGIFVAEDIQRKSILIMMNILRVFVRKMNLLLTLLLNICYFKMV